LIDGRFSCDRNRDLREIPRAVGCRSRSVMRRGGAD